MRGREPSSASHLPAARPTVCPKRASWRCGLRVLLCAVLLPLIIACSAARQTAVDPGYYRVQRGDTLTHIARKAGRTVDELRRWNRLPNANRISVGQVLRISPPGNTARTPPVKTTPPLNRGKSASTSTPSPAPPPAPTLALVRPAPGQIVQSYNGSTSRGITIANAVGTPVVAAAAGSVKYAGAGLRAYGNLVIIQHDSRHLTIYAHNRALLVKEGQNVSQGQKIAEMGGTGSNRVALYFELRRDGQPVNPSGAFR